MRQLFTQLFETAVDARIRQAVALIASHNKQVSAEAMRLNTQWLGEAAELATQDHAGMAMLAAIDEPMRTLATKALGELIDAHTNHARTQLILQASSPFCGAMLTFYSQAVPREMEGLARKSVNIPLIQTAVGNWLYWLERDHVLRFLRDPDVGRLPWQEISPLVAYALDLGGGTASKVPAIKTAATQLQGRLAHLVLLSRTLSRDLQGRQLLIADQIADRLAGFTLISHQHSNQTPFGQATKSDNPPTMLTQSPTLATHSDKRLFYGLEGSLRELEHLEMVILGLQKLPEEFDPSGKLTVAETLAVIRHLKSRWNRQRIKRFAERKVLTGTLDLAYDFAALRRLLLQGTQPPNAKQSESTVERVEIENVSASGAGLRLRRGTLKKRLGWLKLGALVAIKTETMRHWRLGLVRRAVSSTHDEINIGLQFLGSAPIAVALSRRVLNSPGGGTAHDFGEKIAAIYLHPEQLNRQQHVLLAQGEEIEVGKQYGLSLANGDPLELRVKSVMEIGADVVFYDCELVCG